MQTVVENSKFRGLRTASSRRGKRIGIQCMVKAMQG